MPLYTKITRYGTEAEWLAADPVLSAGERAYATDKGKNGLKIGDGVTLFSALPYTLGQAAAQADSVAADVAGIVADHNALLAKLRAAGLLAT